ncbi:Long-chain-fatty-acid--CoA ligase [Achlya hypogyna]|uniref:Long-chain-fatty-acid--CoA ligase n=1 Tax=Achlya hypogyna TaxID=1202772 RepID=A0A0A7CMP4_ACHHY|nr:secreted protein [Achlya hypogyna]OQR95154.1 Long-chain-fatty-acid--CoA ligase [Achlya hypogyna]
MLPVYLLAGLFTVLVAGGLARMRPMGKVDTPAVYCRPDTATAAPGHGPIYRVGAFPKPAYATTLEALQASVAKYATNPFLGHRPIDADGVAGPYVWLSYQQAYERIRNLASGLVAAQLVAPMTPGVLCIYMKNCPEWVIAQYATLYCGGVVSCLYDSLGAASSAFILRHTEAPVVFCTIAEVAKLSASPTLRHIVLCDVHEKPVGLSLPEGTTLWTIRELGALGRESPIPPAESTATATCFLMYTSGTTGDPKGVQLSSANVLSCMLGIEERLKKGRLARHFNASAVHLSYLPLPHILEQLIHCLAILYGASIGFSQGPTTRLMSDLGTLRPTLFVTVPRLLNKIFDTILAQANAAGGVRSALFQRALRAKREGLRQGYTTHPFWDRVVFAKVGPSPELRLQCVIQKKLGLDRCIAIITGSAPASDDVLDFFRCLFTCPIIEGYGQSECTGAATITDIDDLTPGTVGPPMASCEIKLVSVSEMGYEVTDTVHGDSEATRIPVNGRGEVCYRGPSIFAGYFKDDAKTKEAVDAEGWLHSGDIGVWTLDGRLKIVDRKKNIFKLSQGEYVAPEKIENIIKSSVYVAQPFVYGDSLHAVLVGIIVPEEPEIMALAKSLGLSGSFAELCRDPKINEVVLKDIVATGKKALLNGFEAVRAILLHPEPFTVENDLLTPTFKIKRNDVKKLFLKEIQALYAKTGDVVAGKNVAQH